MSSDATHEIPSVITQYALMQRKREEQRTKTRVRMAKFRQRLKELPAEQQEPFKERARLARARYREMSRRRAQNITEEYTRYMYSHPLPGPPGGETCHEAHDCARHGDIPLPQ